MALLREAFREAIGEGFFREGASTRFLHVDSLIEIRYCMRVCETLDYVKVVTVYFICRDY